MIIETISVGPLQVNCYLVGSADSREVFIIDPGDDPGRIRGEIQRLKLVPRAIINTHAHIDHVGGVQQLRTELKIPYFIHEDDVPLLDFLPMQSSQMGLFLSGVPEPDRLLTDSDMLEIGEFAFQVIHTPGHSPGGICLYGNQTLFSGDTLFAGSVGRGDLPGGNFKQLIMSIREKLLPLDDDVMVYPGHGPATTIGREKQFNPYLRN